MFKSNYFHFVSAVNRNNTVLYLLCAALAVSLIVIASLIYSIKNLKTQPYMDCNGKQSLILCINVSNNTCKSKLISVLCFYVTI